MPPAFYFCVPRAVLYLQCCHLHLPQVPWLPRSFPVSMSLNYQRLPTASSSQGSSENCWVNMPVFTGKGARNTGRNFSTENQPPDTWWRDAQLPQRQFHQENHPHRRTSVSWTPHAPGHGPRREVVVHRKSHTCATSNIPADSEET